MKSLLPLILVGLGVFFVAVSLLWPILFPASNVWTDEKANRMTDLQNETHKLLYLSERAKTNPQPGGPTPTEARAKFDAAMAELDTLKEEFANIRDSPQTVGSYFRWTGISLVLLGGFGVMLGRNA